MRLRIKSAWLWLAVIASSAILAGESQARASGISVKIGQQPGGGDPPYDYVIQVYLDPGYGIDYGNWFNIQNLTGVTSGSFTTQPIDFPAVAWSPEITQMSNTFPYASDVQWFFTGNTPYNNTSGSELYLGEFQVKTTVSFSTPPYMIGTPIYYNWSIVTDTGQSSTGTGVAILGIPEPASALLLSAGVGFVSLLALGRQYRRRSLQQLSPAGWSS
jgi:hypothetical protein